MNSRFLREDATTLRQGGAMHFVDPVKRVHFTLKLALQFLRRVYRQLSLRQIKRERSHRRDNHHHGGEQLNPEA